MKHFRMSLLVTLLCLAAAGWWGARRGVPGAFEGVWMAAVLAVMEVSLSFDNAVVNASVLKNWDAFWRRLFLGLGILVAVFGMRLLFPLLIVAVAADLGLGEVWRMALDTPQEYAMRLSQHHAEVAAFGSMFLLLVFLNFLFDEEKEHHWLGSFEKSMGALNLGRWGGAILAMLTVVVVFSAFPGRYPAVALLPLSVIGYTLWSGMDWLARPFSVAVMLVALLLTAVTASMPHLNDQVWRAGLAGILVYIAVDVLGGLLELSEDGGGDVARNVKRGSAVAFLYLELLDASFSFDGVIGAFAITSDIVIIMLGLAIGAMFVRSLTVYLVEQGTLDEFVYLEHGAHYAIGVLALTMLASVYVHVPELLTGLAGILLIGAALWSSLRQSRADRRALDDATAVDTSRID